MGTVTRFEHPSYKLGEWVTGKEVFELADESGEIIEEIRTPQESIGFVMPKPPKIISELKGWFRRKPVATEVPQRGDFIGKLTFGKGHHQDDWVLEVYGREYMDIMSAFADRIAEAFDVNIQVSLETEYPKREYERLPVGWY